MRIGCVNVRGWGTGKFEDLCKELNEWSLDVVGITETHLRDVVHMEGNDGGNAVVLWPGCGAKAVFSDMSLSVPEHRSTVAPPWASDLYCACSTDPLPMPGCVCLFAGLPGLRLHCNLRGGGHSKLRSHGSLPYAGKSSQESLNAAKETLLPRTLPPSQTKPSQAKLSQATTQTFSNI
ncbi:uncharacterized protein LOC123507257 [Portunus trituberculatus]|uniref:uncharacterized protein LOC123507257 n=1 Tax=Portunus trituberculatus TaxID=210409 RepID=UPI001E1CFC5A|nr:uncharacterized protein LOC123507257 [Portunus trituberculatus]